MFTLAKRILSSALNFQFPKFKYIRQVFEFHMNIKTKLIETFATLQKIFLDELNNVNLKRRLVGLL